MVDDILVDEIEKLKAVLAEKEVVLAESIRAEEAVKQAAAEVEQKKTVLLTDLDKLKAEMEPTLNEIKGLENQIAQIGDQITQREDQVKPQLEAIVRIEEELKSLEIDELVVDAGD